MTSYYIRMTVTSSQVSRTCMRDKRKWTWNFSRFDKFEFEVFSWGFEVVEGRIDFPGIPYKRDFEEIVEISNLHRGGLKFYLCLSLDYLDNINSFALVGSRIIVWDLGPSQPVVLAKSCGWSHSYFLWWPQKNCHTENVIKHFPRHSSTYMRIKNNKLHIYVPLFIHYHSDSHTEFFIQLHSTMVV